MSSVVISHSRPVVVFEVVVIARLELFFGAMLFSGVCLVQVGIAGGDAGC